MASRQLIVVLSVLELTLRACSASTEVAPLQTTTVVSTTSTPLSLPEQIAPLGWQSVQVGVGVEAEPIGVWTIEDGFVLLAVAEDGSGRQPGAWRSTDGTDWVTVASPGPVVDDLVVDAGTAGIAVAVPRGGGWDELAVSEDGVTWRTIQPPIDWISDSWREADGFEYVHAGFDVTDIEVGPQGVAAVLTRDAYVDFETAAAEGLQFT